MALISAVIAAVVWIGGAALLPHDVQAEIAGVWNGVLLTIVCVGLVLWAGVSLWTQGRREGRKRAMQARMERLLGENDDRL